MNDIKTNEGVIPVASFFKKSEATPVYLPVDELVRPVQAEEAAKVAQEAQSEVPDSLLTAEQLAAKYGGKKRIATAKAGLRQPEPEKDPNAQFAPRKIIKP